MSERFTITTCGGEVAPCLAELMDSLGVLKPVSLAYREDDARWPTP